MFRLLNKFKPFKIENQKSKINFKQDSIKINEINKFKKIEKAKIEPNISLIQKSIFKNIQKIDKFREESILLISSIGFDSIFWWLTSVLFDDDM